MIVTDFVHPPGGERVQWRYHGVLMEKRYGAEISATVLSDGSGVLIVEPGSNRTDNARIFNGDGTERKRISNPLAGRGAICFTDAGYHDGELVLICRLRGLEMACVIEDSGEHLRQYEIR